MNKKITNIIIGFLLGIGFLFLWIKLIDVKQVITYAKNLNITFLILAGFFYLTAYVFRSLRWRTLLSSFVKISVIRAFLYWMSGNFLNYLIPIRAGEIIRSYFLKKSDDIPISQSLPSVFLDKMFDSMAILIVIVLIPIMKIKLSGYLIALIVAISLLLLVGLFVIFYSVKSEEKIVLLLKKLFSFLPEKYYDKIKDKIELFVKGTALFKNHFSLFPKVVFYSFAAVFFDSMFFLFMFKSFGQPINYLQILFGYTLIYLSYIIPQPPAQIGSNELIMLLIFSVGMGYDKSMVSAIMMGSHIFTAVILISVGLIGFAYSGVKIKESFEINTK